VPSCGYWWGIAPKAHTSTPRDVALAEDEQEAQTNFTLMHTYHENDQLFPNAMEQKMAFESGKNRVLLINWKPATDMTWAAVARGQADARIDRLASYLRTSFPYPFFLTIWHEPENDVNQTTGSGMTAGDYAAMFRHVVLRLRADGATKPVIVMNYMGFDNYALKSWFPQLWPGDDVVDWIGIDPYGSGTSGVYQSGDFNTLVNRKITGFPGYYTWATTNHPGKPIMLAEWGVNEGTNNPSGKAAYLDSVSKDLPNYPAIKSLAYFDENNAADTVAATTTPDSSAQSLDAFRRLCNWADATGPHPTYNSGYVGSAS
jgi:beta-mannanase